MDGKKALVILAIIAVVLAFIVHLNEQFAQIENQVLNALEQKDSGDVSRQIKSVHDSVESLNMSMGQLGLTDEVVQEILRQGYISEARSLIHEAAKKYAEKDVEFEVDFASYYVKKAGTTLEELGYSDEVVQEILRQGYISEARSLMQRATEKKAEKDVEFEVNFARVYAKKAGITLADL